MSKIEFDLVDYDYFSKDIDSINKKLDNLSAFVNSNFKKEKNKDLYVQGFNNIVKYLEDEKERLTDNKKVIDEYKNAMSDIENKYKKDFSSVSVPSFEYKEPSLRPVVIEVPGPAPETPTIGINPGGGGGTGGSVYVETPSVPEPVNLENPTGENEETKPEEVLENTEDNDTTLENINDNEDGSVVDTLDDGKKDDDTQSAVVTPTQPTTPTETEKPEEKKKDNSNTIATIGAIAGAVGLVGVAAGAGVAVAKKKKEDEEEDDNRNNNNNRGMYGYRY